MESEYIDDETMGFALSVTKKEFCQQYDADAASCAYLLGVLVNRLAIPMGFSYTFVQGRVDEMRQWFAAGDYSSLVAGLAEADGHYEVAVIFQHPDGSRAVFSL